MKKLLAIPLILICLMSSPSLGGDLQKGVVAFQNGDFATALLEWTPLAEQGNVSAQSNLGTMYSNGKGVPKDYKTAVKWFTFAAEQGNAIAQSNLGVMYGKGLGVIQDLIYAHMWLNIAASNGNEPAVENRKIVAENMTPSQIEKAQDLARECVAKNYKGC